MKAEEVLPLVGYLVSNSPKLSTLERGCLAHPLLSRVPMPKPRLVTLGSIGGNRGQLDNVPLLSWLKTETDLPMFGSRHSRHHATTLLGRKHA